MTAKTYISDKPCINGHGFVRLSSTKRCPICQKLASAAWYTANAEENKAKTKAWKKTNSEKYKAITAAWQKANPEKKRSSDAAWAAANPEKYRALRVAKSRRYHTRKDQRCPTWLTLDDHAQIQAFYVEAQRLTGITGVVHAVDHVVPLHGAHVSGLHVPWNLQVLTRAENSAKGNRYATDL